MNFLNNLFKIIKNIKKFTLLETLVFVLIIILSIIFFKNITSKEPFDNNSDKELIKKSGSEIFDDYYANIFDDLTYNDTKHNYEIEKIINTKVSNKQPKTLDIGCGTGHHVYKLNKNKFFPLGIDISPAMIKKSKENYPSCKFKTADALNTLEFDSNKYTHITCLGFTIYYIKNKQKFLENCFNWLTPGGVLILHLVDINNFDTTIPVTSHFDIDSSNKYSKKRKGDNSTRFSDMHYRSNFKLDKKINPNTAILESPNAIFKEIFKFKNSNKVRINEHKLYMSTQKSILTLAKDIGFVLKNKEEMSKVQHDNNYLYTLKKPS